MPNQLPPFIEEKVVAFALGYPGMGARRMAYSLGQERWGSLQISHNGVARVLRRHGLCPLSSIHLLANAERLAGEATS